MFVPAVSAAKALIYGLLNGTGEPVPFQVKWLFGGLPLTAEVSTAQVRWGRNKKSRRGGMLDQADFGQGSGVTPDSGKTVLRSRLVRLTNGNSPD